MLQLFWPLIRLTRLNKPQGAILVFWPFAWGLTLAAYRSHLPLNDYLALLSRFFVGAILVRSTAVTLNDICDRNIDGAIERTRNRPLAEGSVSLMAAIMLLLGEVILCLLYFRFLNTSAFYALLIGLFPLAGPYPLMKRVVHWPQAWLGISANWGLVISWLSVYQSLDFRLMQSLMLGLWCWTMYYDTIYACQDKRDDRTVGVKSTAILFGSWIRHVLALLAVVFIGMLVFTGILNDQGIMYYVFSVGPATLHIIWQLYTVDLEDQASCWRNFARNGYLGGMILGGLMLDYLYTLWTKGLLSGAMATFAAIPS